MILAVDIGGTKIHAALYEVSGHRLEKKSESLLATADVPSPGDALASFVRDHDSVIEACALGVAGPVLGDRVPGSNLPWELRGAEVSKALGGVPVRLLNDLEAAGYGLEAVAHEDLVTLQAGNRAPDGNRALVSPGTGLGETILVKRDGHYRPVVSEAGHADFAPRTDEEVELWRWLRGTWGRATWERVVSGPGLVNVFLWLRESGRVTDDSGIEARPGDSAPAALITRGALEGGSAICREALRIWVDAFGAEAGNVALRGVTTGGVFLGGGIPARVLPALQEGSFLRAFCDKAPQDRLAASIPVHVVRDTETTLRGAAIVAAELAAVPR
jgi:glucokinase